VGGASVISLLSSLLFSVPPSRQSFSVGGASLLGVLLKKCSNFGQKTPPI